MPSNIQTTYDDDKEVDQENNPMLSPTTNWKRSAAKAKHNLDKILSDIGELNIDGLDKYVELPLSPLSLLSRGNNTKNQKLDASSPRGISGLNSPTKKKKVKPFSPSTNASNHEDDDELQQIPTVELLQQSDDIIKRKEEGDNNDDIAIIVVDDNKEDTTQVDDAEKAATAAAALMKERIASEIENRRKEEEERARLEEEQQRLDEEKRSRKAEEEEKRLAEEKKAEEDQARLLQEKIEKRRKEEEEEAERARAEQQRLDEEEKAALELEKRRKLEMAKLAEQEEEKKKQNNNEQTERQAVQDLVNTILQLNTKQVVKEGKSAYYTILGVDRDASLNNIKKGYRKRALKLHPDKDKYSTPNAEEAFRVVSQAYNVLSDPESRRKYDDYQQKQRSGGSSSRRNSSDVKSPTSSTTMSEQTKKKAPSQYNIIPSGTRVTISGTHVTTFNGLQGCILEYDRNTSLYTVQMDGRNGPVITAPSTSIFQNVIVCLRANKAPELACAGVFLVTLSSYYKDNCGGCYQARYSVDGGGGRTKEAYLRAEQFIIPNGTVVRVGNEHGLIVDWREESTGYTQVDSSYYEVQMSDTEVVRVKMANVRL